MDPVISARAAREGLAQSLALLQTPGLAPGVGRVVEQVAQAMGLLHRIEATRGAAFMEAAPAALGVTRQALGELQSLNLRNPEVDRALEAIAASLGTLHHLAQGAVPPAPTAPPLTPARPNAADVSPYAGTMLDSRPQAPSVPMPVHHHPSGQQYAAPVHAAYPPSPQPSPQHPAHHTGPAHPYGPPPATPGFQAPAPHWQQSPQQGWQQPPQQGFQPPAQPPAQQQPAWQQNPPSHQSAPGGHAPPPHAPHLPAHDFRPPEPAPRPPSVMGPGAPVRIEAALGAHSPTNFYKGLSGNDVIESGGLFVATYQIPPLGTQVLLKVALPGGYEFDAVAVVRWARETRDEDSDAPPGFGAAFVQIAPEARTLVYRYVRNREPLVHDEA